MDVIADAHHIIWLPGAGLQTWLAAGQLASWLLAAPVPPPQTARRVGGRHSTASAQAPTLVEGPQGEFFKKFGSEPKAILKTGIRGGGGWVGWGVFY
jgi:hypothetical protein